MMLGLTRKLHSLRSAFQTREAFIQWFFSHPAHQWVKEGKFIESNLLDFFEAFPLRALNRIFEKQEVTLVPSSGKFACSVWSGGSSLIIVFPELRRLLDAPNDGWAKAVLAHEFGHLYHCHGKNYIDPLEAQVEADRFAIELGYMPQLLEFLEEQPESIEKRTRLAFVTSSYFKDH